MERTDTILLHLRGWAASLSISVSSSPLSLLSPCLGWPRNGCVHLSRSIWACPDPTHVGRAAQSVDLSPASLSSPLLCLWLTTLHPDRHLAPMSGHKLPSSPAPNYYLSIRRIWTHAFQSVCNDNVESLTGGINSVISDLDESLVVLSDASSAHCRCPLIAASSWLPTSRPQHMHKQITLTYFKSCCYIIQSWEICLTSNHQKVTAQFPSPFSVLSLNRNLSVTFRKHLQEDLK